jgi:uncharacterized OB-fold protein
MTERRATGLPTREPPRSFETAPFWDALAEGRFVVPRCEECGEHFWYPRRFCPFCASTSIAWPEVSGRATLYSFTVIRKGQGPYRDVGPYVLAIVELEEGPRLMTNVLGVDPEAVRVGQALRVVLDPAGERDNVYRFEPA